MPALDRIWAPWRAAYVKNGAETPAPGRPACFICKALAESDDRANHLVWRRERSLVVLNRFPYNNGHLLVAPKLHEGRLQALQGPDLLEPLETLQILIRLLDKILSPQGYNVGLNLGKASGAGLPGHLHWHLVPRWDGDSNFMPVVADAKVIVESLDEFYERLAVEIANLP